MPERYSLEELLRFLRRAIARDDHERVRRLERRIDALLHYKPPSGSDA
jgi:hypothetical protein